MQYYWPTTTTHYGRVREDFVHLPLEGRLNLNIFECGCSFAETTRELHDIYPKPNIIAADLNEEIIDMINEDPSKQNIAKFKFGDGLHPLSLGIRPNSMHLVFNMNVLYHEIEDIVNFMDLVEILNEYKSIAMPGGFMLFSGRQQYQIFRKEKKKILLYDDPHSTNRVFDQIKAAMFHETY
jgi:hypothetical protein